MLERLAVAHKASVVAVQLWIAYQVLEGLAVAHKASVHHGDIKTENVLLTSWHWAYLADWASYKPVCLPADHPVSRRSCPSLCLYLYIYLSRYCLLSVLVDRTDLNRTVLVQLPPY